MKLAKKLILVLILINQPIPTLANVSNPEEGIKTHFEESDSSELLQEKHNTIENARIFFEKNTAINWYDEYFYHVGLTLLSYADIPMDLSYMPEAEIKNEYLYPLLAGMIKYRKLVTHDMRELNVSQYSCMLGDEIEESLRYVFAYAQRVKPNICTGPSKLEGHYQRHEGLYTIVTSVFPEEEDPFGFAVKNKIVSPQYLEGQNKYLLMNNAELGAISSHMLDYLWNNRGLIKKYEKVEKWYDEYFDYVDETLDDFYYDLSEKPGDSVKNFEIYKILVPIVTRRDFSLIGETHEGYLCGEADFIFVNDVYTIDLYTSNVISSTCKNMLRNKEYTRFQGVELLINTLFEDVEDVNAFGVSKGLFSNEYLSDENKDKFMNHAELAKIASMILRSYFNYYQDF